MVGAFRSYPVFSSIARVSHPSSGRRRITMHARARLIVDLIRSFPRAEHKTAKLLAYAAYYLARWIQLPLLEHWRARHPMHAFILVTTRCNMRCEDCCFIDVINRKGVGKLDCDLDQIKRNYARGIFKSVSRVVLFGGEPTLCRSFADIIRFFRSKGIVVCLTSNALRVDASALEMMRESGLNMLNLTIYEASEHGKKYNLGKLEEAFRYARQGAFSLDRMGLCYHSVEIEGYRRAYEFSLKVGARHLLFNRLFHTAENPRGGQGNHEEPGFARQYLELCREIAKDGHVRLYHPAASENSAACPYTTNAIVMSPTDSLSPCCLVTPSERFGTLDRPDPLLSFKSRFIRGDVPSMCRECHMLGTRHL